MPDAVVKDWNQFSAFLAAQPFCQWTAEKQREIATGVHSGLGHASAPPKKKKDDNADLVAALSSMA